MIDPSTRLRRAIHLKDAVLVRRIVQSHPTYLKNPNFDDKSNSNLHLAAEIGHLEVAQVLLDAGHDRDEVSRNTDFATPLMLAVDRGNVEVATLLIKQCPRCIPWTDRSGMDALSIAASRPASASLIPQLLSHPLYPASVHHRDNLGNTPLHHASASGSLKALRVLLEADADPTTANNNQWLPLAFSLTVAAEVYFKQLISEFNASKRASSPTTPNTLTRAATVEPEPVGLGSPSPVAQRQLRQSGSRDLLRRKTPGVRLVSAADDIDPRPSTAEPSSAGSGWSPRSSSRVNPVTSRPGYFDSGALGRSRASSSGVIAPARSDSLT